MGGNMKKGSVIDCIKAQELFFERSEKALNRAERDALRAHEASCEECRRSFAEWELLRTALRDPDLKVAPPPDFTRGVMARIAEVAPAAEPAKGWGGLMLLGSLKSGVRRHGLAAAAVILALLTGSLSLTGRLPGFKAANNTPDYKRIVQEERSQKKSVPELQVAVSEKKSSLSRTAPGTPGQPAASGEETEKPAAVIPKASGEVAPGNADASGKSEKVFLNKTRVITTTMLKIQVSGLEQARSSAISLARSEGASLQSEFATQNNGHRDIILRLTVPNETAQSLVSRLTALGSLMSPPQVSREDITGSFASTLREYQALQAELATAPDEERERLKSQISFLENQLQRWDEESNKQVVIVLLEE